MIGDHAGSASLLVIFVSSNMSPAAMAYKEAAGISFERFGGTLTSLTSNIPFEGRIDDPRRIPIFQLIAAHEGLH